MGGVNTGEGKLNLGHDVTCDITLRDGRALSLGITTDFDAKPKVHEVDSKGLDGINRYAAIPQGWNLSFSVDRANRDVDDWWAAYEASYYSGDVIQNVTVTQRIRETDGTISIWRYTGVSLHYDDAGRWKSSEYVKQTLKGSASRKIRVA